MKWTKEPWPRNYFEGAKNWISEHDYLRAVDCVNACENIEDPEKYLRHHERIVGHLANRLQDTLLANYFDQEFIDDVFDAVGIPPTDESDE